MGKFFQEKDAMIVALCLDYALGRPFPSQEFISLIRVMSSKEAILNQSVKQKYLQITQ